MEREKALSFSVEVLNSEADVRKIIFLVSFVPAVAKLGKMEYTICVKE